jgi:hypothetical protein
MTFWEKLEITGLLGFVVGTLVAVIVILLITDNLVVVGGAALGAAIAAYWVSERIRGRTSEDERPDESL